MSNFADRIIWTGDILHGLYSASVDLIYVHPSFNSNRNSAAPVPYPQNKHVLFGRCNGCCSEFPFRVFRGGPRNSLQRQSGQHRRPPTPVPPLQPGQGRSPAGIPSCQVARVRS